MSTPISKHVLSKSTFLRGCQCAKSLYLYKNQPELKGEISGSQQLIFDRGTDVGFLARNLFPGGIDASPSNPYQYQEAVVKTQELIESKGKIIYEAAFQFDDVLCATDILVHDNGKWKCFEVKSSTEVKEVNLLDAALQYYIITNCGIHLDDISIVHINNQYVRKGDIDVNELFNIESIKDAVLELQPFVKQKIVELKKVTVSKVVPETGIGVHCSDPYDCDFIDYCWSHIPEVSVFDLVRMNSSKKFELYEKGIVDLKEIPKDLKLTEGQQLQVTSYIKQKSVIDKASIKKFISQIKYPICHLDFETFQSPIPMFDDSKPYQQIPFQYSLHHKGKQSDTVKHFEHLAEANFQDPRIQLIEKLLEDTTGDGTILTYNQSFEVSRMKEMAEAFPKYKREIEKRISRINDLMIPFQKRWYYKPEMNGSYSIKAVLPALFPELSYEALAIGDGGTASAAFESLYSNSNPDEVLKIRNALLEYCKMDTFAMVKLLEHLEEI